MTIAFWVAAGILLYAYAGYPLLLWLIVRVRGARPVRIGSDCPRVTLIISAYNEAAVIRDKLENVLRLDYPLDRLEVVVVSDASADGTDEIVLEYAARGVRLIRQENRQGKTAGLNLAIPQVNGDVVVFSDANAMYAPDAVSKLVRNFADPEVGCVTGEARYVVGRQKSAADAGERAYWNYEIQVKRLETAVGSMVGGDGAIYAIRKELWRSLPTNAINDFLNPLQIVAAGWRAVYEPEAVCFEETAGGMRTEYRRRIRIVSRSWRALFQARGVLNPFSVGFFTIALLSHKVLRWLSGVFAAVLVVSLAVILLKAAHSLRVGLLSVLLAWAVVGLLLSPSRRLLQFAMYFAVITSASLIGLLKGSLGRVSGTWSTPREAAGPRLREACGPLFAPGTAMLFMGACGATAIAGVLVMRDVRVALALVFWSSLLVLVYVYILYPAVLAILTGKGRRQTGSVSFEPTVCLFITANDEGAVIGAKLRNTLALDYPREKLTIVVASDGSVDQTNAIVRSFEPQGVTLLPFPERRGKIAAINDGIATVTADIVIFSDANTFLDPGAIKAIVRNFADATVGAVSGDVILEGDRAALGRSEDLYYRYERWLQARESQIGTMVGVDGALYGIRRELFVPPPPDTILDDMAIPMAVARAGARVVFEPDAQAHERGSDTATEEFIRKSRVVAGAVQFLSRPDSAVPRRNAQLVFTMISHKALRWLSPAFAMLAFGASLALAYHSTWFMALAAGQTLFLLAAVAGCNPVLRRMPVIGLAHYFWLVQAAAALGFIRGLIGRQPVAWRRFGRAPVEST
jgi:cellulose synthase/poly-beta-1,6-N-acetylglucosamine synthase-like glycosyltransferase